MPVWDRVVRAAHWLLVMSIAAAWFTRHGWGVWHEWAGYASLLVVGARLAWGLLGTMSARFATFVASPAATLRYARQVLSGSEPRYLGHNPLGGWMVIALLSAVAVTGASGWLYTTDEYWGAEWVERVHSGSADALLVLVALHVAGVLFTSLRHRENLVASMIHGRKRPSGR
ncbi:MAG: cytochrome b/b6 domain-containing protein [Steroidobacteraceae bacterium]